MIKAVFALKDSTIYSDVPTLNVGLDEILEIRSTFYSVNPGTIFEPGGDDKSVSRALLKFDISDFSSSIASGKVTTPSYYLRMYNASPEHIKTDYAIEVRPLIYDWDMGVGKKSNNPITTDGVSWKYKSSGSNWDVSGSDWYTGSAFVCTQSFHYESADLYVDVTPIVNSWVSGTIDNNGFIVKYPTEYETSSVDYGILNFFSRDTHTIYPPMLYAKWDDSVYVTSSLSLIDINDMVVFMPGLRERYKMGEVVKVNVFVRDKYPVKTYGTGSRYLSLKRIPTSSYYSVKDAHTEEVLIPFDNASTKISFSGEYSYFNFDTSGLQPERYYKFVLKLDDGNNVVISDDKFYFKVER